jgi:hypothetical protein
MPTLSQATSDTLAKKLQSKKLAKIQREGRPLAIHHELLGRGGFVRRQQQHNGEVTHNHSRRPRFTWYTRLPSLLIDSWEALL